MNSLLLKAKWIFLLKLISLVVCSLGGCAAIGPNSLKSGRRVYNEAINKTAQEQTLLAIVQARYGEPASLLNVASLTANVRIQARAGVEIGVGPKDYFEGNLVPLSGGVAFEENPTITYLPVAGPQYMEKLMSPIPLDICIAMIRNAAHSREFITAVVSRVNDMKNPHFVLQDGLEPDPQFDRFVELIHELQIVGSLEWVQDSANEEEFIVVIQGYSPESIGQVKELMNLLDIQMPTEEGSDILIPVSMAIRTGGVNNVAITTRSVFDLAEVLSASLDVPSEHTEKGLTLTYPLLSPIWKGLRVLHSKTKPENASVAVKYRDCWFYIDQTDMRTKMFFRLLSALWSVSMTSGDESRTAPVLTVPVSR
ncbi:MAG: hypothetical protein ACYSTT_13945 [Planctomycetota bacterium]|jgi:hypothetical protein